MLHLQSLGLPDTQLVQFLVMVVSGLLLYFGLSGTSYAVVFVLGRKRFHPDYKPDRKSIFKAIRWAVIGTVGTVLLQMPFNLLAARGQTRIYWKLSERSPLWLLVSLLAFFVLTETGIYWVHRAMHTKRLFKWFHRYHHQWRRPTSWVSVAFHPIDSFAMALPLHLAAFVVPIYGGLFVAIQLVFSLWAVSVHDRHSIVHWRWFNHTDNHTLHHWFFRCNYGQFTTFWDRVMRTWRDPVAVRREGRLPKDVLN
jgi:lathosterol oxidase